MHKLLEGAIFGSKRSMCSGIITHPNNKLHFFVCFLFVCLFEIRTDLGKCTHQCNEAQENYSTQTLSTKMIFFGCKKIDNKRRRKYKEEDRQEGADVRNVKNE